MSERGKDAVSDFDGDDFLLVIIQQNYLLKHSSLLKSVW